MEKEVQQLKINASNIRSILVRRSSDLKKIRSNRKNLERITKEKQKRTLKEKVIESSRQTTSNIGNAAKNISSKLMNSKAGGFFKLFLLGVLANNIGTIIDFFRGDIFKKIVSGFKSLIDFFKNLFKSIKNFFSPSSNDLNIPDELNDEKIKELEKINDELKGIKKEADKLNEFSKSAKEKYDILEKRVKDKNQDIERNFDDLKSNAKETNTGLLDSTGEIFKSNSMNGSNFVSMNMDGNFEVSNIKPVKIKDKDLSMERKKNTKVVVLRQPVLMGEK